MWAGVLSVLGGLALSFGFLGTATNCGSESLTEITTCQNSDAWLHIGFGVLGSGAFLILLASVAAVRRDARARKAS
jgi:hypothetical protein